MKLSEKLHNRKPMYAIEKSTSFMTVKFLLREFLLKNLLGDNFAQIPLTKKGLTEVSLPFHLMCRTAVFSSQALLPSASFGC